MCFSAIPGQNGHIRAMRFVPSLPPKQSSPVPKPAARINTVPVFSGLRMRTAIYWEYLRRENRKDHRRGKGLAKRTHKPNWREYVKY